MERFLHQVRSSYEARAAVVVLCLLPIAVYYLVPWDYLSLHGRFIVSALALKATALLAWCSPGILLGAIAGWMWYSRRVWFWTTAVLVAALVATYFTRPFG